MAKAPGKRTSVGTDNPDVERLNVDYVQSNHFRTLTPSGVMSSITPQGQIQVALYAERQAIPQRVVYKVLPDGSLGDVIEQVSRDAVIREVEIALTLDRTLAKVFARRLSELVKELEADDTGNSRK